MSTIRRVTCRAKDNGIRGVFKDLRVGDILFPLEFEIPDSNGIPITPPDELKVLSINRYGVVTVEAIYGSAVRFITSFTNRDIICGDVSLFNRTISNVVEVV